MTKFEKHIENAGKEYSLSADEKARMQGVIASYMRHKPIRAPYSTTVISYGWISILHRPAAAALVLVLVFGSGVSYAAEGALPGDALYTVKTVVNEPVRVALAANAEVKAEVQMEIAERRIEEAAVLSAEGRLDDSTQDELAASFKSYAAAVSETIEAVAAQDASATLELAARFETRLIAHESVLAEVEMETEAEVENDTPRSHRLTDAIRETNERLADARFSRSNVAVNIDAANAAVATSVADAGLATVVEPVAMTMSLAVEPAADTTTSAKASVEAPMQQPAPDARTISRMKNAAEKSLAKAQKTLRNAKNLSAEAKARAEVDISLASDLLENGEEYLEDDLDAEAYAAFEESLRVSEQTSVYIKAAPALEKARSRNSRNRTSEEPKSANVNINVSLPGGTITATVISPTSSPKDPNDMPVSDTEESGEKPQEDGENEEQPREESGGVIKNFLKLNISL